MHTINSPRDYYCNKKFWHLKIDLESRTTYNCHAAQCHPVDLDWLTTNPGQLFNLPVNVQEREQMLQNIRNSSCEQNCWHAEDLGQSSPRLADSGGTRSHDQIQAQPRVIDITIGSDCNLTCSYCCKEFSSAWRNDIDRYGDYPVSPGNGARYQLLDKDRVLMKLSQQELMTSRPYNQLLEEIKYMAAGLEKITVTGGEPFLNNRIINFISTLNLSSNTEIDVFTGLGVNPSRFARVLDSLVQIPNLVLSISAENIGDNLEFNRYGVSWKQFETNLAHIRDRKIKYRLHSTITNLTAFGFRKFWDYYKHERMGLVFAFQPRMQAIHVMDEDSKMQIMDDLSILPTEYQTRFRDSILPRPSKQDHRDMCQWLSEFLRRRPALDPKIYPRSFLSWLEMDHVV